MLGMATSTGTMMMVGGEEQPDHTGGGGEGQDHGGQVHQGEGAPVEVMPILTRLGGGKEKHGQGGQVREGQSRPAWGKEHVRAADDQSDQLLKRTDKKCSSRGTSWGGTDKD